MDLTTTSGFDLPATVEINPHTLSQRGTIGDLAAGHPSYGSPVSLEPKCTPPWLAAKPEAAAPAPMTQPWHPSALEPKCTPPWLAAKPEAAAPAPMTQPWHPSALEPKCTTPWLAPFDPAMASQCPSYFGRGLRGPRGKETPVWKIPLFAMPTGVQPYGHQAHKVVTKPWSRPTVGPQGLSRQGEP